MEQWCHPHMQQACRLSLHASLLPFGVIVSHTHVLPRPNKMDQILSMGTLLLAACQEGEPEQAGPGRACLVSSSSTSVHFSPSPSSSFFRHGFKLARKPRLSNFLSSHSHLEVCGIAGVPCWSLYSARDRSPRWGGWNRARVDRGIQLCR